MALDTESTSFILFITLLLKCRPDQDRSNDNVKFAFVSWPGPQQRQRQNRIRLLIRTAASTTLKSHSSPDQDRSDDNVEIAFVSWSGPQRRQSQNHIRSTNWQESYWLDARIWRNNRVNPSVGHKHSFQLHIRTHMNKTSCRSGWCNFSDIHNLQPSPLYMPGCWYKVEL